ncbi:hypothetical protein SB00610_05447 [Klebsiella quasipneumoniae subsp. similipneumoniae]|nr:hypothetical protein SB00610_05447 [Klebsiella quasipneumoniae subsp. similipneumoniae]
MGVGKIGHLLRHILVRGVAEAHADLPDRSLHQAERRAGYGQADRHLRADWLKRHPLRELIHHKAHTLMPAVESHG